MRVPTGFWHLPYTATPEQILSIFRKSLFSFLFKPGAQNKVFLKPIPPAEIFLEQSQILKINLIIIYKINNKKIATKQNKLLLIIIFLNYLFDYLNQIL
jgi:hypothetical protein